MSSEKGVMVNRTVLVMLLLSVLGAESAHAEPIMTLKECIETGLRNQPSIRTARASVDAGLGREMQAASPYFPQVSASTGYSENHAVGGAFGDSVSKGYTTTLSLNQLIYDFGRSGSSLDAAKLATRSSEQDADRVNQEVVLNVKQSYYALLAAKKLVEVAQKTIEQTQSHLRQAEAFFRAGSKPRFDVTRAEVDVNNARVGMINAKNGVRIRTIALNNAMGVDPGRATEIEFALPSVAAGAPSLEQAQNEALKNRPEMLKAETDREAANARVRTEESNYYPTISAAGAYNWANGTQEMGPFKGEIQNSWNAGVTLTVPLFQGGLTKGRVSEARANLLAVEAQRDSIRQTILLEVNQAYVDLEGATARAEAMETSLKKAQENLELAQGRYEAGVGPYIEVTDAQLASVNAETDRIQALYDYYLAAARLLKATGRGMEP
jgi:TolC family type I secretion outer membrane protein